ncbi:hypothetical protein GCM10022221_66130 [Actinocorallia aurea]
MEDHRALLEFSVRSLASPQADVLVVTVLTPETERILPPPEMPGLRSRMNEALLELLSADPFDAWTNLPVLELDGPLDERPGTVLAASWSPQPRSGVHAGDGPVTHAVGRRRVIAPSADPAIQARISAYNAVISPMIDQRTARGDHVLLVEPTLTLADLVHPNDGGHRSVRSKRNGYAPQGVIAAGPPGDPDVADALKSADLDADGLPRAWLRGGD